MNFPEFIIFVFAIIGMGVSAFTAGLLVIDLLDKRQHGTINRTPGNAEFDASMKRWHQTQERMGE